MKKQLQTIFEEITAIQDRLLEIINTQEEIHDGRSEKWQESEKGEAFMSQIELLNEIHENLDNAGAGILEITE
jgi:hypothetical protein